MHKRWPCQWYCVKRWSHAQFVSNQKRAGHETRQKRTVVVTSGAGGTPIWRCSCNAEGCCHCFMYSNCWTRAQGPTIPVIPQSGIWPTHRKGSGFTCATFCAEWVQLTHKHTLDNALLRSENCAEVDTKWRWTVTERCLKQVGEKLGYSAPFWLRV